MEPDKAIRTRERRRGAIIFNASEKHGYRVRQCHRHHEIRSRVRVGADGLSRVRRLIRCVRLGVERFLGDCQGRTDTPAIQAAKEW